MAKGIALHLLMMEIHALGLGQSQGSNRDITSHWYQIAPIVQ